jgi:putative membrane protein
LGSFRAATTQATLKKLKINNDCIEFENINCRINLKSKISNPKLDEMKHFLLTWLGTALALLVTSQIVPGFIIKTFVAALGAAIVIGLVNAIIRPILIVLAFPITLITFGLFTFVINALTLWLASAIIPGSGFEIQGFIPAFLGSIVLAIVSSIINYVLRVVD